MAGGTIVGLDIGANQIKVVEMKRGSGGLEVTALGVAPTPVEAFDNNIIIDPKRLGQAVKELMKSSGVSAGRSVSSVSGQSAVVVRVIEVPQMKPNELAETMKWEVERHVPFSANEVIMDYQPIDRPEGLAEGQNMEVLLAVAQQDMVDRHVEMLFAAGLKPVAIDVEPLAVSRILLESDSEPRGVGHTVALVNIGASNTDIGIFRDKLLAFPRNMTPAGDHLTNAIAAGMGVDSGTAENYKREYGEVMFGQQPQMTPDFGGGFGGGGGGFMDFGAGFGAPASEPEPTVQPTSSPSGRFDFSGTSETAAPVPSAPSGEFGTPTTAASDFGAPPAPSASPFDFMSTETTPSAELPDFSTPNQPVAETPSEFMPDNQSTFSPTFDPTPAPSQLPVVSQTDPQREMLKTQVFNCMAPVLSELVQELRRSLDYYRGKAGDAPINEILLTGGTAKLRNLAPFIEAELGIPTRIANPFQYARVTSRNFSPEYLDESSTLFSVAVGLGIWDLVKIAAPAKPKPGKAPKTPKAPKEPKAPKVKK